MIKVSCKSQEGFRKVSVNGIHIYLLGISTFVHKAGEVKEGHTLPRFQQGKYDESLYSQASKMFLLEVLVKNN